MGIQASDVSPAGTFQSEGRALRVEAVQTAKVIGWFAVNRHPGSRRDPALVERSYGHGKVIFMAFDLGLSSLDYQPFAALMRGALTAVHRSTDTGELYPHQLVPVELNLEARGGAMELRLTETYPELVRLFDLETSTWVSEHPWVRELTLAADTSRILKYLAFTPDQAGSYVLTTHIASLRQGSYQSLKDLTVELTVTKDKATLLNEAIAALCALQPGGRDCAQMSAALRRLRAIQARTVTCREDVEANLKDLIKCLDYLSTIRSVEVSAIGFDLDQLLFSWEGRWYYWP